MLVISSIHSAVSNCRRTSLFCALLLCMAVPSQQLVAQFGTSDSATPLDSRAMQDTIAMELSVGRDESRYPYYRKQLDTLVSATPLHGKGIKDTLRVMFIGSSLTEVNNLPRMFGMLASTRARVVIVGMIAQGGSDLTTHLKEPRFLDRWLHRERWDYVVFQGVATDSVFHDAVRKLAVLIRNVGAQPVLYTTAADTGNFKAHAVLYAQSAHNIKGILVPVTAAWMRAWKDTTLSLYMDGWHPSVQGTYLGALMLYRVLMHASTIGLPAVVPDYEIENQDGYVIPKDRSRPTVMLSPSVAAKLQRIANEASLKVAIPSTSKNGSPTRKSAPVKR